MLTEGKRTSVFVLLLLVSLCREVFAQIVNTENCDGFRDVLTSHTSQPQYISCYHNHHLLLIGSHTQCSRTSCTVSHVETFMSESVEQLHMFLRILVAVTLSLSSLALLTVLLKLV